MKCKHFALLLLASNFLLTSLPALAELEDAPLPGDFQSTQPAKQAKPPSPAPQPRAEKPQGHAETITRPAPSRKQAVSRGKPTRKATASVKSRRKAAKIKQRSIAARRAGMVSVKTANMKAGKKQIRSTIRKNVPAKHIKKQPPTLRSKLKPAKKTGAVSKKPLKIKKKKAAPRKVKK